MDILDGLNPAQKQAVETIEGPLLILAGPGSGKTRVIVHRIAYLIKVCGVSPRRIMAVTFTNKAANEMKERLHHLLSQTAAELTLGTFHAICARILRQEGRQIALDSHFVIYDEEDQLNLIKRSLQELDIDTKDHPAPTFRSAISSAKSRLLAPQDYARVERSYFYELVQRVYERYQELLAQSKALDFDDLLMKAVFLFRERPQVLAKYQSRYVHLLIDEFQDTNLAQYELAKQLAGKYRNICVVGDPDQSIYSWRFADLRNILNFEKDFPEAKVVLLEQNYRSTQTVLKVASQIISINPVRQPRKLWTQNETGVPVTIAETYTEREEGRFVASEVERLGREGLAQPGDCAVMYRTNAQSRVLEETFIRYGIPYRLVGGTRFYQRREVKDVIAYLRLLHNPYDSVSLSRIINVPGRGIGAKSLEELTRWAKSRSIPLYTALQLLAEEKAETSSELHIAPRIVALLVGFLNLLNEMRAKSQELSLVELLDLVLERTGYKDYLLEIEDGEERWDNILELRTVAQEYQQLTPGEALASFLESVALVSDVDELEEKVNVVTLTTLHQAKGLEFPVVFIVGMEEGVLPHFRSWDDPEQMEEERRLCYVGVTRAKQRLYLVRAFRRSLMGSSTINPPSRYLTKLPPDVITWWNYREGETPAGGVISFPAQPERRVSLPFKAGDLARHAKFGEGIVIDCSAIKDDYQVTVAFKEGGLKKLLLSLAPLEKIQTVPTKSIRLHNVLE